MSESLEHIGAVIPLYGRKSRQSRNDASSHFIEPGTDYTLCGRIYVSVMSSATTPECEACQTEWAERHPDEWDALMSTPPLVVLTNAWRSVLPV